MVKILKIIFPVLFLCVLPLSLEAATLSVSPTSGTFEVGDQVVVKVVVSSGAPINAISGTVSFPTSIFSVESVSKVGSILNFWVVEPNFSKGAGNLQFEGVTLGGFGGGTGTVVLATLRALKVGTGKISFVGGQVLANDGQGTDVTGSLSGAVFSVEPKKGVPKTVVPEKAEEPEVSQPASLQSPEISLVRKFGEKAVYGVSSYPNTEVLLTFLSETGVKIFITGHTDQKGEFTILVPQTLKRGVYKTYAIIVQRDVAYSVVSNEITVTIGNIFSDISLEIKIYIILLILLLIYLIIRTYLHLRKNKKLRSFVKHEAKEAEAIVHQSFKALNNEIGEVDIKEMKKDFSEAEDLITKEIKDIEKL